MLSVNALDFMNYKNALKGNYRKGVHAFRCILENPTQAADFAANLGGVCVVFGVPIGQDDRNSQQLLALLQASSVIDQAALTWLSQWYADYADDWDTMAGDTARASAIAGDALIWRAVGSSPVGAGKVIAAIAGLSCQDYADMAAVAASSTAMTAVAASQTAMAAVAASSTAMAAVAASQTAMTAVAASQTAMAAVAASQTAMAAVAASQTAMAAVAASTTARAAICASDVAFNHLLSLATYDTVSGTTTGSGWSTRYSKPCIVLQWCYSYQSGTSGIRTCLDGNASRQYTGSQRYNSSMGSSNYNDHNKKSGTYYKEFVFCSKLETYNSQGDWPAISIAYFKLP